MTHHSRELFPADPISPELANQVKLLPHPHMKIVLHFLAAPKTADGAVLETGMAVAQQIEMNRSLYARKIKEVVADGWLEPAAREQNIQYYRLGQRAGGVQDAKVIPLRRVAS